MSAAGATRCARGTGAVLRSAAWGGFGGAPKFPHPANLEFCLRRHAANGDATALEMALVSLRKMADGGVYDQIGGGFCRYSVDEHWAIPHFEKMLYDNGPLLALYSDAWVISGDARFKEIVEGTAAWVMREMQSPAGRLLRHAGCGLRARGGQVLRLDAGAGCKHC